MYTLLPMTGISGVFYLGLGVLAMLAGAGSWLAGMVCLVVKRVKEG